jgi:cell division septum initiation protein DivIVA
MDDKYDFAEFKSDIKYIKQSIDEIKDKVKEHDDRISSLEKNKVAIEAVDRYKKSESEQLYRSARTWYVLLMIIFTALNIGIEIVLKVR